jgi:hypothetical protein
MRMAQPIFGIDIFDFVMADIAFAVLDVGHTGCGREG